MEHFKNVCPECKVIHGQCRCMDCHKPVRYVLCDKCKEKAAGDVEIDVCNICGETAQVSRKYYHYEIDCACCVGNHFEIVKHCSKCIPVQPDKPNPVLQKGRSEN